MKTLEPGIYGLSNHLLDTPWPKVIRSRHALVEIIEGSDPVNMDRLSRILYDQTQAEDDELPDTGFSIEWERVLSSPFIVSPDYGTRSSTTILIDNTGYVDFTERSYDGPEDPGNTMHYEFTLQRP
jgi:uncharacterized protein with NRDE domain